MKTCSFCLLSGNCTEDEGAKFRILYSGGIFDIAMTALLIDKGEILAQFPIFCSFYSPSDSGSIWSEAFFFKDSFGIRREYLFPGCRHICGGLMLNGFI